jgi:hypothetical protein
MLVAGGDLLSKRLQRVRERGAQRLLAVAAGGRQAADRRGVDRVDANCPQEPVLTVEARAVGATRRGVDDGENGVLDPVAVEVAVDVAQRPQRLDAPQLGPVLDDRNIGDRGGLVDVGGTPGPS